MNELVMVVVVAAALAAPIAAGTVYFVTHVNSYPVRMRAPRLVATAATLHLILQAVLISCLVAGTAVHTALTHTLLLASAWSTLLRCVRLVFHFKLRSWWNLRVAMREREFQPADAVAQAMRPSATSASGKTSVRVITGCRRTSDDSVSVLVLLCCLGATFAVQTWYPIIVPTMAALIVLTLPFAVVLPKMWEAHAVQQETAVHLALSTITALILAFVTAPAAVAAVIVVYANATGYSSVVVPLLRSSLQNRRNRARTTALAVRSDTSLEPFLRDVLANPIGRVYLLTFLSGEFAAEDLLFLIDVDSVMESQQAHDNAQRHRASSTSDLVASPESSSSGDRHTAQFVQSVTVQQPMMSPSSSGSRTPGLGPAPAFAAEGSADAAAPGVLRRRGTLQQLTNLISVEYLGAPIRDCVTRNRALLDELTANRFDPNQTNPVALVHKYLDHGAVLQIDTSRQTRARVVRAARLGFATQDETAAFDELRREVFQRLLTGSFRRFKHSMMWPIYLLDARQGKRSTPGSVITSSASSLSTRRLESVRNTTAW